MPRGYFLKWEVNCVADLLLSEVRGSTEFKDALSVDVSTSFSGFGLSASVSSQKQTEKSLSTKEVYF